MTTSHSKSGKVTMKTISDKVAARLDKQDELAKFNRYKPVKKTRQMKDQRTEEQISREEVRKRMDDLIERRRLKMEIDWL